MTMFCSIKSDPVTLECKDFRVRLRRVYRSMSSKSAILRELRLFPFGIRTGKVINQEGYKNINSAY